MSKVNVDSEALTKALKKATNLGRMTDLLERMIDTILRKNADYGNAWQRFGLFTPLVRLNDKLLRVINLADGKPALVADERIQDTLMDIAGYAVLALVWLDAENSSQLDTMVKDIARAVYNENVDLPELYKTMYTATPISEKDYAEMERYWVRRLYGLSPEALRAKEPTAQELAAISRKLEAQEQADVIAGHPANPMDYIQNQIAIARSAGQDELAKYLEDLNDAGPGSVDAEILAIAKVLKAIAKDGTLDEMSGSADLSDDDWVALLKRYL